MDRNQFIYWKCPACKAYNTTAKVSEGRPAFVCHECKHQPEHEHVLAQHPAGVVF